MTTQKQPTARTRTAATTRLRGLATATVLAPLLALGACSSEAPVTADPTRASSATTSETTAGAPGTATTPSSSSTDASPTSTTAAAPKPTNVKINVILKDPILGHTVTAGQVRRNMAFPSGHPVASSAFEIVGVYVTLKAGDRYSAPLEISRLVLGNGPTYVQPTSEFGTGFAKLATDAKRGQTVGGWLIYKIDKDIHPLVMMMHRPAYQVSTTDKAIPSQVFTAKLTD
jgi:hypothetical protein